HAPACMTRGGPPLHANGLKQGFDTFEEGWRLEGDGVERAAGWLAKRPAGKPFLLVLHADDAEAPYAEKTLDPRPADYETATLKRIEQLVAELNNGAVLLELD